MHNNYDLSGIERSLLLAYGLEAHLATCAYATLHGQFLLAIRWPVSQPVWLIGVVLAETCTLQWHSVSDRGLKELWFLWYSVTKVQELFCKIIVRIQVHVLKGLVDWSIHFLPVAGTAHCRPPWNVLSDKIFTCMYTWKCSKWPDFESPSWSWYSCPGMITAVLILWCSVQRAGKQMNTPFGMLDTVGHKVGWLRPRFVILV